MQTFLCFLDNLPALVIEILLLICTILGILMTFYGLSNIPFDIGKKGFQIFFEFNNIWLLYNVFISIVFVEYIFLLLLFFNN